METDYENVWHKACRRPKGSPPTSTGQVPLISDRAMVGFPVLILTVSCRLWVKSILQQVAPSSGWSKFGATQQSPGCHHLWCVLVYVDVTLRGTCWEAHQSVPTVATLGMALRSLTKLHPDRHSLALTRSCDCTSGVNLAAFLCYSGFLNDGSPVDMNRLALAILFSLH